MESLNREWMIETPAFVAGVSFMKAHVCYYTTDLRRGAFMARYDKRQIVQIIENLLNANQIIKQINIGHETEIADMLQVCQEAAILVGTQLEVRKGLEHIVHMLESYCESLYEFSMNYTDAEARMANFEKIQNQLLQIKNVVETDLPEIKKEMVFLPYKASMWDSLESVWKAANVDPECDAYVIPIPYYDKNPDGTFREFHYEGNQYPDYVPITRYEEYDLGERHPDVIYIHNPYDDENYVTTVDPEYYSDKLQAYTDKLVYIPYFVLKEPEVLDSNALEKIESYCLTAGVINADKVIVQSGNMQKAYIKLLTEKLGECDPRGRRWNAKIYGDGSPKIDKIKSTSKKEIDIPSEWLKLIVKQNGEWKKIILYNTGLTALLQDNEQMLKKIESVFKFFYCYKNDIVLLWRPHPLIESTLISMRPELYMQYEQIKKQYISGEWGIYDVTSELDRAIILSDAYYGDSSSIVQLCKAANKSIMIQNVAVQEQMFKEAINVNSGINFEAVSIADKEMVYGSLYDYNGLYKIDLKTGECDFVNLFVKERVFGKRLHCKAVYSDGKIYFIPGAADYLSIFNVETQSMEYIAIPLVKDIVWFYKSNYKFCDGVIQGNFLWLLPASYPGIIKYNIETHVVECINDWVPQDGYFFRSAIYDEMDNCYMASGCNNIVLKIDFITDRVVAQRIGEHNNGVMCMCKYGDEFIFAPRLEGAIIQWNPRTGRTQEVVEYPVDFQSGKIVFSKNYLFHETIFFVPAKCNFMLKMDCKSMKIRKCDWLSVSTTENIESLFETQDALYFRKFDEKTNANHHFKIMKDDNSIKKIEFKVRNQNEMYEKMGQVVKYQQCEFRETDYINLRNFLNFI